MIEFVTELERVDPDSWLRLLELRRAIVEPGVRKLELEIAEAIDGLCPLVEADAGAVVFTARTAEAGDDMLEGWRPIWFHNPAVGRLGPWLNKAIRALRWGRSTRLAFESAGLPRVGYVHEEMARAAGADKSHFKIAKMFGVRQRLNCITPVTKDLELWFLFDRRTPEPRFEAAQVERALAAMHALGPLGHRWGRMLGALDGGGLLSPRERDVLVTLLEGHSEKLGADRLGLKESSFHQHAVRVYRKLKVSSRGELMAKWLTPRDVHDGPWSHAVVDIGETSGDLDEGSS